jgi:ActR/RegA family two-component response regulator
MSLKIRFFVQSLDNQCFPHHIAVGKMKTKPNILIVEDEQTISFAMKSYFSVSGFEVDCAMELEEAQAFLSNLSYSVVVADLCLTGIGSEEGLEIITFVRQNCPKTKIVLLTAYKTAALEFEARRRGANFVLSKPQPLVIIKDILNELTIGAN